MTTPGHEPPTQYGGPAYAPKHPSATTALVVGILGLVVCSVAAPFAWRIGAKAVREIDQSSGQYTGRGEAQAGKIMGIIGTVLLILGVLVTVAYVVLMIFLYANDSNI